MSPVDAEAWNHRYDTPDLIWAAEPNRFLPPEVADLPLGRSLDLACGEGRNTVWLAEQGWEAKGVDFSDVALAKAAALADHRGVDATWECASVVAGQADHQAELVIVFYLQLPASQRQAAFAAAARAVAPGGTLLIVGHATTNLTDGVGGPQDPAVLYEPADVVADLTAAGVDDLEIERAVHVDRPVDDRTAIDVLVRARRAPSRDHKGTP